MPCWFALAVIGASPLLNMAGGMPVHTSLPADIHRQISWVQDMIATVKPDMITVQPPDDVQIGPAIQLATDNDIPCFAFDTASTEPIVS